MRKLRTALLIVFFAIVFAPSVHAAGLPQIYNPIPPENFTLGLFGADDDDQDLPVVIDETASSPFRNLSSAINNDRILGMTHDSTLSFVYAFHHENEAGSGEAGDLILTKLDSNADIEAGFPLLIDPQGGGGNAYSVGGFIKAFPDDLGGVHFLYYNGSNGGGSSQDERSIRYAHREADGSGIGSISNDKETADMAPGPGGSAYVLHNIGYSHDGFTTQGHGRVMKFLNTGGIDFSFAGGAFPYEVTVSTNTTSDKQISTIISDGAGGGIVMWYDDESGEEGIYGQRFDSSGLLVAGWPARGKQLYASTDINTDSYIRGASSGVGNYYAVFRENDIVSAISFDGDGDPLWACTQTLADTSEYVAIANQDGADPGLFVVFRDGDIFAQHFEESNGNSTWTFGGVSVASGVGLNAVFPDQAFQTENKSSSAVPNTTNTGVDMVYTTNDGFQQLPTAVSFSRSSYGGGGGDCAVGAVPDAPTLSVDVIGNTEVDLSLIPGADNGSAHTDFVWEYKEASSGVWIPFPEGMNLNTALTITGLTNGVLYDFRAAGVNGIGQGPFSGVIQATPIGAGGRRRLIPNGGALFFFGSVPNAQLGEATGDAGSFIGRTSDPGLRGSAPEDNTPEVFQESTASPLAPENFSIQEYLSANLNTDKTNSILLLDLIVSLRWLMEWSDEENQYELLKRYESLGEQYERVFRTRWFHRLAGVEYLERIRKVNYNFDYRFPVQNETENVIFMMRSVLLTFGRSCIAPEVLAYAEEVDVPGQNYEYWYYRYLQIMKPWMDAVLGEKGYQVTRPTDDIDALEALFILLHQFCIGEEFKTDVIEDSVASIQ